MSIGSLGSVGSFAASSATQRTSDTEKTQTASADKSRADSGVEMTEKAAGIGETQEDTGASDRDADGRRLWEVNPQQNVDPETANLVPHVAKDPTGAAGGELDLMG
ncbi:hypothetical protein NA78x_004890 [Anatilimnocola sp. NA78]|uniref:hypothetical protein n=1 Tax=Anatilimnocola sp. NA78 TaxID=3415683 RepID=UPI003CE4AA2C